MVPASVPVTAGDPAKFVFDPWRFGQAPARRDHPTPGSPCPTTRNSPATPRTPSPATLAAAGGWTKPGAQTASTPSSRSPWPWSAPSTSPSPSSYSDGSKALPDLRPAHHGIALQDAHHPQRIHALVAPDPRRHPVPRRADLRHLRPRRRRSRPHRPDNRRRHRSPGESEEPLLHVPPAAALAETGYCLLRLSTAVGEMADSPDLLVPPESRGAVRGRRLTSDPAGRLTPSASSPDASPSALLRLLNSGKSPLRAGSCS